jgi:hypothetical protein
MAAVTHVCTIAYVAEMLNEDPELLEAIIYNDDNMTYGNIVSVYTGSDACISALTDEGIDELTDMIKAARITTKTWHAFLDDFVDDPELVERVKNK